MCKLGVKRRLASLRCTLNQDETTTQYNTEDAAQRRRTAVLDHISSGRSYPNLPSNAWAIPSFSPKKKKHITTGPAHLHTPGSRLGTEGSIGLASRPCLGACRLSRSRAKAGGAFALLSLGIGLCRAPRSQSTPSLHSSQPLAGRNSASHIIQTPLAWSSRSV